MPAGAAPGRRRGHPGGRHRRRGRLPGARRRRPARPRPGPPRSSWPRRCGRRGSPTSPCTGWACRTPGSHGYAAALRAALRPAARRRRRLPRAVGRRPAPGPPRRRARRRRRRAGHRARLVLPDLDVGVAHAGRPRRAVGPGAPAPARRRRSSPAKRAAIAAFTSQVGPGPDGSPPVLDAAMLAHTAGPRSCSSAIPAAASAPVARFAELYAAAATRGGPTPGTSGASGPSCWRACRGSGTAGPSNRAAGPVS